MATEDISYCIHRPPGGVLCVSTGACHRCGWNPDVEEKRKEKIREELGIERVHDNV